MRRETKEQMDKQEKQSDGNVKPNFLNNRINYESLKQPRQKAERDWAPLNVICRKSKSNMAQAKSSKHVCSANTSERGSQNGLYLTQAQYQITDSPNTQRPF